MQKITGIKGRDGDRFQIALGQIVGKRLTFEEVTGKVRKKKRPKTLRLPRGKRGAA